MHAIVLLHVYYVCMHWCLFDAKIAPPVYYFLFCHLTESISGNLHNRNGASRFLVISPIISISLFPRSWKTFSISLLASSTDMTGIRKPIRNSSVTNLFALGPFLVTRTSMPSRSTAVTRIRSTSCESNKCSAVNAKSSEWSRLSRLIMSNASLVRMSGVASLYSSTGTHLARTPKPPRPTPKPRRN